MADLTERYANRQILERYLLYCHIYYEWKKKHTRNQTLHYQNAVEKACKIGP
jgi:hypothetical protein